MALFFLRSVHLIYTLEASVWSGTESNVNPWTSKMTARFNDKNAYASSPHIGRVFLCANLDAFQIEQEVRCKNFGLINPRQEIFITTF